MLLDPNDPGTVLARTPSPLLSELSLIDPLRVTHMLMQRVDRQASLQSLDYDALPHHSLGPASAGNGAG